MTPEDFVQQSHLLQDRLGNNIQSLILLQETITQIAQDYQALVELVNTFAAEQLNRPSEDAS
ncbi:MAG: hypothetical protein F6J97_03095 [Leptolyngbya sp. SIO4C1]|nr:hypothetical protein [Leptolyngbya sp. SIO4C1]